MMKKLLVVIIILAVGGGVYYWWMQRSSGGTPDEVIPVVIKGSPEQREEIIRQKLASTGKTLKTCQTAIESYRVDAKTYPSNLAQLTTPIAYMVSIPQDEFTQNRSIQYKKISDTDYLAWSIGADGKDDHAQTACDTAKGLESNGDIIVSPTRFF